MPQSYLIKPRLFQVSSLLWMICSLNARVDAQPSHLDHSAPHLSHTSLAQPPISAELRCLSCLETSRFSTRTDIRTYELLLEVRLMRDLKVPLRLHLKPLPEGVSLKSKLPATMLTEGKLSELKLTVLIDDTVNLHRLSDAQLEIELHYQTELSGLTHTVRWPLATRQESPSARGPKQRRALPIRVPYP